MNGEGAEFFSDTIDICDGGGVDDVIFVNENVFRTLCDSPTELRGVKEEVLRTFLGVPGHDPCDGRSVFGEIECFLGGAPTTRNMSQTFVLSINSLTGWYLCVFLLSRSLWMSASIFLTNSFP